MLRLPVGRFAVSQLVYDGHLWTDTLTEGKSKFEYTLLRVMSGPKKDGFT